MFSPTGHFYSPITDPKELRQYKKDLWGAPKEIPGIDFNVKSHLELFKLFQDYLQDWDYVEEESSTTSQFEYFHNNDQFSWLDAQFLYVFLRHYKPRRMIEVGSGFSSLLTADVNRRWLDNQVDFQCIEPYPRDFLKDGVPGISNLLIKKVQDVPVEHFKSLKAGDVLFIDTSHVCKTGSDVNYLYFEVLPVINPGVFIHIHDIFLPFEYPEEWAIDQSRSWNEQYLLHALLVDNKNFEVIFGSNYAANILKEDLMNGLNREWYGGGSFWIKKIN